MKLIKAFERQKEIYINGISGHIPDVPFNPDHLRKKAQKYISKKAWDYVDGGAGDEETMKNNRESFRHLKIIPQMMHDNSEADFSTALLGMNLSFPLLLAPIGALDMVTKNADLQVAAACRNTGVPLIYSNQAGNSMEECSEIMQETPKLFQLYWSKSDDLVLSFVKRAEKCNCKAIVLTVDTTLLGWRAKDLSLAYLPFLKGFGISQYTSDPVFKNYIKNGWKGEIQNNTKPKMNFQTVGHIYKLKSNYKGTLKDAMRAVQLFTQIYTNPALTWDKVKWLKKQTNLPIIIKGILHPEDAVRARDAGADGVIVSNHGGRQVNGAVSSIEMLPLIRKALPRPFVVMIDSGIRTGSDMFKAIALGADACLMGRTYVYGLAIDGQRGVESTIQNLLNDFELTARLSGSRNLEEINEHCLDIQL